MVDYLGRIKLDSGGYLVLGLDMKWRRTKDANPSKLRTAADLSLTYKYGPGKGYPGVQLTHAIAKVVGGTAEVPEPPPMPEGAIP